MHGGPNRRESARIPLKPSREGTPRDTIPPRAHAVALPRIGKQRLPCSFFACADLELSRSFYVALGFELRREQLGADPVHYLAELGSTVFELHPAKDSTTRTLRIGLSLAIGPQTLVAVTRFGGAVLSAAMEPSGYRVDYRVAVLRDPAGSLIDVRVDA